MTESRTIEAAAAFLEHYAEHPPDRQPDAPPPDSDRWREIQARFRAVAHCLREGVGTGGRGKCGEAEAVFLEAQGFRLARVRGVVLHDPFPPEERRRMISAAEAAAEYLGNIVELIRRGLGARLEASG